MQVGAEETVNQSSAAAPQFQKVAEDVVRDKMLQSAGAVFRAAQTHVTEVSR